MLDIIFYKTDKMQPQYIEVSENIYEWLARSHFSKIGESTEQNIEIDGEIKNLSVVKLDTKNRSQLRLFFLEAVAEESDNLLKKLIENLDKNEYNEVTYRLRKLQELRKCVENPAHKFLQRV
ncbi:MAG: hypothetical protein SWY16_03210 [Cyanobacteriota bacterium]|nr:hypothetical protein [Cyanobacteriota bacterium]